MQSAGYGCKCIQISVQYCFHYCSIITRLNIFNGFIEILFTYHTIHPFEVYRSVVLVYLQNFASITTVHLRAFLSPQKKSLTHSLIPLAPPFSIDSPILDFPRKGLIQYVAFCDWLLSLCIVFSRFIHAVSMCIKHFNICWCFLLVIHHPLMQKFLGCSISFLSGL